MLLVSAGILGVSRCSARLGRGVGLPSYLLGVWWFVVAGGSVVNLPLPWRVQTGPMWNPGGTVLPAAFGLLVLALVEPHPDLHREQTLMRLVAGVVVGGIVLSLAVAWCLALPGEWWVQPMGVLALAAGSGLVVSDARDALVISALSLPLACAIGLLLRWLAGGPVIASLGGGLVFNMAVSSAVALQLVLALRSSGAPTPMEAGSLRHPRA